MGQLLNGYCRCGFKCRDIIEGPGERPDPWIISVCFDCKQIVNQRIPYSLTRERPPIICPGCSKSVGYNGEYTEYQSLESPSSAPFRIDTKIRKFLIKFASLFPGSLWRKVKRATETWRVPFGIMYCPNCGIHRMKMYDEGRID
jgi:hypothetical protein